MKKSSDDFMYCSFISWHKNFLLDSQQNIKSNKHSHSYITIYTRYFKLNAKL